MHSVWCLEHADVSDVVVVLVVLEIEREPLSLHVVLGVVLSKWFRVLD